MTLVYLIHVHFFLHSLDVQPGLLEMHEIVTCSTIIDFGARYSPKQWKKSLAKHAFKQVAVIVTAGIKTASQSL